MMKKISILLVTFTLILSFTLFGCKEEVAEEEVAEEEILEEAEETIEEEAVETDEESVQEETEETAEEIKLQALEGEVSFKTEDGIDINGNIFGTGNKWVILSHMYPTDQTSWFDFAQYLADNDYIVLTYDFRGYGKSGGSQDISNIDKDLEAAIVFISQHYSEKIFLMGASMGGTASLIVAAREYIDGVISLSSPDEIDSLSALDEVEDIDAPILFIASQGDENAAASAESLFERSLEPKEIVILDGNSHGTFIFEEEPENGEIVKQIVLDFLNSN
jgi:pimeloyl-ACP methyl ester carboxylesterase